MFLTTIDIVIQGLSSGININNGLNRNVIIALLKKSGLATRLETMNSPPRREAIAYRYTDWAQITDLIRNRRMFLDLVTDSSFLAPGVQYLKAFVKKTSETYFYQLEYRLARLGRRILPAWLRAYHGADIFLVFGAPLLVPPNLLYTKDANFSRAIIKMWTNFAKTG